MMPRVSFLFTLTAALVVLVEPTQAAAYGVGFELSLDYGVASIHFKNGSTVDVAKIEGAPAYKRALRSLEGVDERRLPFAQQPDEAPRRDAGLSIQSLRDWLPPWLGGPSPNERALTPMLRALQAAASAYLGRPVEAALTAFAFNPSAPALDSLRASAHALALRGPQGRELRSEAAFFALTAYGLTEPRLEEQLVLAVEYSRAALSALVVHLEDELLDKRRALFEVGLGAAAAPRAEALEAALRPLLALPLADGHEGAGLTTFGTVLLVGEAAGDARLGATLRRILGEEMKLMIAQTRVTGSKTGALAAIDPTFAPARGIAQLCWYFLEDEEWPPKGNPFWPLWGPDPTRPDPAREEL